MNQRTNKLTVSIVKIKNKIIKIKNNRRKFNFTRLFSSQCGIKYCQYRVNICQHLQYPIIFSVTKTNKKVFF